MSNASGTWTVVIDGRGRQVAAQWDRYGSGGGRVTVDGVVVRRWRLGLKWPGARQSFSVDGHELWVVRRGISDLQLDLYAREAGLGLPVVSSEPKDRLVLVLAVLVLVAVAAVGIAVAAVVAR